MLLLQEMPKNSLLPRPTLKKPEKSLSPGILAEKKKPSAGQGSTMNAMPSMLPGLAATTQTSMGLSLMLGRYMEPSCGSFRKARLPGNKQTLVFKCFSSGVLGFSRVV